MERSETKTESTVTPGSRVETFNTMVSASGLLQLKTFLASPIKIQILRRAFVACPKTFTKNPKKETFPKFKMKLFRRKPTHRRRQKSFSGVGLFPECKYKHTQKGIFGRTRRESYKFLNYKRKILQTDNKTTGKKFKLPPDTNDFHHGGFRSALEKFERRDSMWEVSRRRSKAFLMNSLVYYFRQPTPDIQHPSIKFKTP